MKIPDSIFPKKYQQTRAAHYTTPAWSHMMQMVPKFVLWLLKQNYSFLYTDTDVVMLQDPFEHFPNNWRNLDLFGQVDGRVSKKDPFECTPEYAKDNEWGAEGGRMCAGLQFYNPTKTTT
eukprot:UN24456